MTNLTATQGDTIILNFVVTRKDPTTGVTAPVDLSSAKLWFTAKYRTADTDLQAVVQIGSPGTSLTGITLSPTPTDGTAVGKIASNLTEGLSENTVVLFWDLQLEEADLTITTIDSGRLALTPDVTRAT